MTMTILLALSIYLLICGLFCRFVWPALASMNHSKPQSELPRDEAGLIKVTPQNLWE